MHSSIGSRYPWIRALSWWLLQLGINPRRTIQGLLELPRFVMDFRRFRRVYDGPMRVLPSLHDRQASAGAVEDDYFWQDLHVAQEIFRRNPRRHIDVGSRVDGFIAHVASFRMIEVVDVRPIDRPIPNVIFRRADMTSADLGELTGCCDSLSCLHAIEHFGLGRYGDQLHPQGYIPGIRNLSRMLERGGVLYLSCPVGVERVEYNSHRILDPSRICSAARECGLELENFAWIDPSGYHESKGDPKATLEELGRLDHSLGNYSLGIFSFRRLS